MIFMANRQFFAKKNFRSSIGWQKNLGSPFIKRRKSGTWRGVGGLS
jgi:hypothetical protein